MMNRYRCRTCDFATKQLGIKYCLKVNRVLDVASFNYVGCASHSSQRSERDKVLVILNRHIDNLKERGSQLMDCKRRWIYQDVCLEKATLLNKIAKELRQKDGVP